MCEEVGFVLVFSITLQLKVLYAVDEDEQLFTAVGLTGAHTLNGNKE